MALVAAQNLLADDNGGVYSAAGSTPPGVVHPEMAPGRP